MLVFGRLSEAATRAGERLMSVFVQYGLQRGEFDVLATLRRSGAPFALTPTELYEATMVTSGAMTNRLDRLEKAGLIARKPHPSDRRATVVELTGKGRTLVDEAVTAHVANEHRMLAGLGAEERDMLAALLEKLLESLDKPASD